MERLIVPGFYLICALLTLWCALGSKQRPLIALAALFVVDWGLHNLILEMLTKGAEPPLWLPIKDAVIGLCVPFIAGRLRVASAVFGLFVATMIVHADAGLTNTAGSPSYYATLNGLFALRLITVGLGSGLARRALRGHRDVVAAMRPGLTPMDAQER